MLMMMVLLTIRMIFKFLWHLFSTALGFYALAFVFICVILNHLNECIISVCVCVCVCVCV